VRVLVVGASARAAVHSLARAGFSACAIDLFGDRDLARVAECVVCPMADYPAALPAMAARFSPGPLLYTGGLENYPDIVAQLAASREVWGNAPDVLRRARDPHFLAACGVGVPSVAPLDAPCPAEGRWLRKPLRSGGGLGIRFAQPNEPSSPHHYFQQFIDGVPMSAQFVSNPDATRLNGITEQLIGEPWLHAKPFAYCGNIGPIDLSREAEAGILNSGRRLNDHLRQRGTWGLDFVYHSGTAHPIEINPRYTAGAEVLELNWRRSYMRTHADCFDDNMSALAKYVSPRRYDTTVGKAIYYAPHAFAFPASGPWDTDLSGPFDPWRLPAFADIPHPGSAVEAGSPVLTFFAHGSTPAEVRERLQSRAAELDLLFAGAHP
jgi:predicted ATP-grasp superfamily ATP-dependent carboligase